MKRLCFLSTLLLLAGISFTSCERDIAQQNTQKEGTLNISLATSGEISKVKTRAGEVIPELENFGTEEKLKEFTLSIYQGDELKDQWNYGTNQDAAFLIGDYRVEATYGDVTQEGFELPSFKATQGFTIKDGEETQVDLTAKLANARIKIAYTDAFKEYFADYQTLIDEVIYEKAETRAAYFQPGTAAVSVKVKRPGSDKTVHLKIKDMSIFECCEYRVNMDVDAGSATLNITFDGTVENADPVTIPVSDADLNAAAPELFAENFVHNTPLNVVEGVIPAQAPVRAIVTTSCGIQSCLLKTTSQSLTAQGWPAEIDLASNTDIAALTQQGLKVKGFDANSEGIAVIDFTELIQKLPFNAESPENIFTMSVTDRRSRTTEPLTLKVVPSDNLFQVTPPTSVPYGTQTLDMDITLNGDIHAVEFTQTSFGYQQKIEPAQISSSEDSNHHVVTFHFPEIQTDLSNGIRLTATYGAKSQEITIKMAAPTFKAAVQPGNVWNNRAFITLQEEAAQTYAAETPSIELYFNKGGEWQKATYTVSGAVYALTGLTQNTDYTLRFLQMTGNLITGASEEINIHTETEAQIPGGDMESWTSEERYSNWKMWYPRKTKDEKVNYGWTSMNALTTSHDNKLAYCSNSGTEPSEKAHSGSFAAEIKTIGWGAGTTAARPISIIKQNTPGELFLGKIDGTTPVYGYPFTSRPAQLSFWYQYAPDGNHKFTAKIMLENRSEQGTVVLGEASFSGGAQSSYIQKQLDVVYKEENKHLAATHIRIEFNSGTNTNAEVDKASIFPSSRHIGNILYIDDIQLKY